MAKQIAFLPSTMTEEHKTIDIAHVKNTMKCIGQLNMLKGEKLKINSALPF